MANSLRSKIKKLCHDNNISEKMCNELLEKLEGHDRELRAKVIDEFAEQMQEKVESFQAEINGIRADLLTLDYFSEFVFEIAEQMKGEEYVKPE